VPNLIAEEVLASHGSIAALLEVRSDAAGVAETPRGELGRARHPLQSRDVRLSAEVGQDVGGGEQRHGENSKKPAEGQHHPRLGALEAASAHEDL
jgi:hypothetical protein